LENTHCQCQKTLIILFFVFYILSKWIILFLIVICETVQNKISKWLYMVYLLLQTTISCKSCYRIEWTQNKNVNEKHTKRKKKWWKKNRRENATKQPDYRCYSIQLDSFPFFLLSACYFSHHSFCTHMLSKEKNFPFYLSRLKIKSQIELISDIEIIWWLEIFNIVALLCWCNLKKLPLW